MRRTLLLLTLLLALPLAAHEGIHEQIDQMAQAIARDPNNGSLYLRRAELYRIHREWKDAEADYVRARELDPDLYSIELAMGRMLHDAGRHADALVLLEHYTRIAPHDRVGHEAHARALMSLSRAGDAISAFERAIGPDPEPSLALDYSRALVAGRCREEALRYLDSLAPLVTYQLAAIDLELQAGHLDAALRRIERAEAQAPRKDEWMERRGDVLMKMGRTKDAVAAYRSALGEISALPPERRRSRAILSLEKRLRERVQAHVRIAPANP